MFKSIHNNKDIISSKTYSLNSLIAVYNNMNIGLRKKIKIVKSNKTILTKKSINNDNIYLIYQFFIAKLPNKQKDKTIEKSKIVQKLDPQLCTKDLLQSMQSKKKTAIYKISKWWYELIEKKRIKQRNKEIRFCLKKNVENPYINKIFLINERIYSEKELGIKSNKIIQINISRRLLFSDILKLIKSYSLYGHIITGNADIFYDYTINWLKYTDIFQEKIMYNQLRLEYKEGVKLDTCGIYNGKINETGFWNPNLIFPPKQIKFLESKNLAHKVYCPYSADTWIFHTNSFKNNKIYNQLLESLDVPMGILGVDQIIPYKFFELGYEIRNEPLLIKCYHYHTSYSRDYKQGNKLKDDYLLVFPFV